MSINIYPAYSPPINDVKINEHFHKCFNLNAVLTGLDIIDYVGYLGVQPGSCVSNGVVIELDEEYVIYEPLNIAQPCYLYVYFNGSETNNLPVIEITPTLLEGRTPIAFKINDQWRQFQRSTLYDLKAYINNHALDSTLHITQDQYDALINANSPNISNPLAIISDTSSYLPVMDDELKLLPYSLAAGQSLGSVLPVDSTISIIYDMVTTNEIRFVKYGVNQLLDADNATTKTTEDSYIDNLFGNIIESADSTENLYASRCTITQQSEFPGPKGSHAHKVQIIAGYDSAYLTWDWTQQPKDLSAYSDYIYTSIHIPPDGNLSFIELIVWDGTAEGKTRVEYSELIPNQYNPISLNISDLNKNSIIRTHLRLKYTDWLDSSSSYYYVDALSMASTIDTVTLIDTSSIDFIRPSVLTTRCLSPIDPVVDVSLDNGTIYTGPLKLDEYNYLGNIDTTGDVQLKLRFNLMNAGGDYYTAVQSWLVDRAYYAIHKDLQTDAAALIGGTRGNAHVTSAEIYNKHTDTIRSGIGNSILQLARPGHTALGNQLALVGGVKSRISQDSFYLLDWQSDTIQSKQQLSLAANSQGCASTDEFKLIRFQGAINNDINSAFEYAFLSDSWVSLADSLRSGRSWGGILDNTLYGAAGDTTSAAGIKYNRNSNAWSALSLIGFLYYSTCARLKARSIIYESEFGSSINKYYFSHEDQSETSINAPLTGAGTSGAVAHDDDSVTFGPYEKSGTYYRTNSLYVPYKSPRLCGFAVKYI